MAILLLTGAAGRIGTMLRQRLPGLGHELRLLDRVPVEDAPEAVVAPLSDTAALDAALVGVDAVVHMAGQPGEAPWPVVREANVDGLFGVFEAARRAGVRRVVWASSNHAVGFTPMPPAGEPELPDRSPVRPDTLYGVSKVFGEALGQYYVDRYGFDVVSLRIGTCDWRPPDRRSLATWLSPDDCARLVDAAVRAPSPGHAVVWGVSANTRRRWSAAGGAALGYHPLDDAETYAAQLEAEHPAADEPPGPVPGADLVGGGFTTAGFGLDEVAARWETS